MHVNFWKHNNYFRSFSESFLLWQSHHCQKNLLFIQYIFCELNLSLKGVIDLKLCHLYRFLNVEYFREPFKDKLYVNMSINHIHKIYLKNINENLSRTGTGAWILTKHVLPSCELWKRLILNYFVWTWLEFLVWKCWILNVTYYGSAD